MLKVGVVAWSKSARQDNDDDGDEAPDLGQRYGWRWWMMKVELVRTTSSQNQPSLYFSLILLFFFLLCSLSLLLLYAFFFFFASIEGLGFWKRDFGGLLFFFNQRLSRCGWRLQIEGVGMGTVTRNLRIGVVGNGGDTEGVN